MVRIFLIVWAARRKLKSQAVTSHYLKAGSPICCFLPSCRKPFLRHVHPCRRRTLLLLARVRGGGRQDRPHPCRALASEEITGAENRVLPSWPFPEATTWRTLWWIWTSPATGPAAQMLPGLFCWPSCRRRLLRCTPCRHVREIRDHQVDLAVAHFIRREAGHDLPWPSPNRSRVADQRVTARRA